MLKVENLEVSFRSGSGWRSALRGVSFEIARGEILGMVGESGSGKTLGSLAVMGLLPPNAAVTKGRIEIDGQDVLAMKPAALRKMRGKTVAMIFQDPMASLDPVFTCGQQIVEAIRIHEPIGRREAETRALALLERVRIPDPARAMDAYPHELSGGQCQRVMIAMAVACKPRLIIADEPTTALDVTVQKQVLDLLKEMNREVGAAILLITHDLGVVNEVADRVVVLCQGEQMETQATADLFATPQTDYARALIAAMPAMGERGRRLPTIERDAAGRVLVSAVAAAPERKPSPPGADPLLELVDVEKSYRGKTRTVHAVAGVSFRIPLRTTLGLVGESGCGKTTLSRMIMRSIQADGGAIRFAGDDLLELKGEALRRARRNMGVVFQNPYASLNPRQTVAELISAPMEIHNAYRGERDKRVAQLLDAVGLPREAAERYPHEFSGGQRQRIAIARALALNPQFVICDEAVSALDVSVQAQVLNLLQELQAEFDLTYLFISHDLAVVEYVSDTICVMQAGRIVESGPAEQVFARPQHDYTRLLLDAAPRFERQGCAA